MTNTRRLTPNGYRKSTICGAPSLTIGPFFRDQGSSPYGFALQPTTLHVLSRTGPAPTRKHALLTSVGQCIGRSVHRQACTPNRGIWIRTTSNAPHGRGRTPFGMRLTFAVGLQTPHYRPFLRNLPAVHHPWDAITLWQLTDSAIVPGVSMPVDLSLWLASVEDMTKYQWAVQSSPPDRRQLTCSQT